MLQSRANFMDLSQRGIRSLLAFIAASLLCLVSISQPAPAQTYKVIHNFTGKGTEGATPYGGIVLDRFGNLYGTTYLGGIYNAGTVYQLSAHGSSWLYSSLHSFKGGNDGAGPGFGALAVRNGCSLFGTTEGGGVFGTAFEVRPSGNLCPSLGSGWRETVVHTFGNGQDGAQPIGGVAFDSAGNFYGTTSLGGAYGNGAVFQVAPSGVETVIYSFTGGSDGANPVAGVTVNASGNLYGTTSFGGANGVGEVYELSPSASGWTETVLYNFQGLNDGQNPVGGVVLDQAGNLYGTTFDGGMNGGGTVYQLSPSGGGWTLTTLYSFTGGYGGPYNKLTLDKQGNIYGFTNAEGANGLGSVFKLTPGNGGWTFSDLHDFAGGNDGGSPYGSLAVDASGNVFGTAVIGGSKNQGLVFEITP